MFTFSEILIALGVLTIIFILVSLVDAYFKQKMHDETNEFLYDFDKRDYLPFDLNITEKEFANKIEESKKEFSDKINLNITNKGQKN